MAKPKSIYPLKGIFLNFLQDTNSESFLIPTYQRGYKWASLEGKGQVDILLKDLMNAYKSNNDRYYLQFLTLKSIDKQLEVIDGQQRLTTLTILFCVLGHLRETPREEIFVLSKLTYQTRQNFVEKYIYNDFDQLLNAESWIEFRDQNPEHDNQDVYFIFHAAKAIQQFINANLALNVDAFYEYICRNVYLIVNLLDSNLNSEKVFINVNKGVKLNDEDLVKGLLITKLPLDHLNQKYRSTEFEINELRTNLGRQWDDLSNWAFRSDIRSYFKADVGNSRLEWLIRLAYPEIEDDESGHAMFIYFDELHSHQGVLASDIFDNIRRTKMVLNDWYSDPEIRNLLGYILHAHRSPQKEQIWADLKKLDSKRRIINALKEMCKELLPLDSTLVLSKELSYEDNTLDIFNVFLMLDISKFLPLNGRSATAYDFSKISSESWSLEHIFPQNVQDFKGIDKLSKSDLAIVKELVTQDRDSIKFDQSDTANQVLTFYDKLQRATDECIVTGEERQYLGILISNNAPELHKIGNLALLVKNMNSGLSNHFFSKKREILVRKVSEGKFVPFHTYDVFSKLVIATESGLNIWSKQDIIKHEEYINNQIAVVTSYLTIEYEDR